MNSAATETEPRHRPVAGRRRSPVAPGSSAVLVATSAAEGGGAAALQPWEDTTLLARLVDQFTSLGIERVHVLTRPAWAAAVGAAAGVEVHAGEGPADDLRAIGRIAAEADGALVVAYADVVTQREVLAGLLAEPRMATGIISTGGAAARPYGFKTRARRGRIVSAGSPYHAVRSPTGTFLGVVKVAPADRARRSADHRAARRAARGRTLARVAGGVRVQDAALAPHARAVRDRPSARGAGAAARAARRGRAVAGGRRRARAPARDRAQRCHRAAARRPDPLGRARQARRICARCSGRGRCRRRRSTARRRPSSSTTRTASCSTRRSRARTASSRPSSSRPTRSTSRAGRPAAG